MGQRVEAPGTSGGSVAAMRADGALVAVCDAADGVLRPRKVFVQP
jgi:hypothetical protein